jgi:isoleucyl-tRNA synthetase
VQDPAVIVSFPVLPNKEYSFLAWTTTPWTLPSNLGLCVKAGMTYVKVKDKASGDVYVLARSRLHYLYPVKKGKAAKEAPKEVLTFLRFLQNGFREQIHV